MTTTLVLGGGFGGLACARTLRQRLPAAHRIVLVDRSTRFVVGATKTWVMLGTRAADEVVRRRAGLVPRGVEWVAADITAIDPARRTVESSAGAWTADHLVIALGAEPDLDAIPGLGAAAHTFYTLDGAARLRGALEAFDGGRIVLLVARSPFPCPPAPYEAAMLLHDRLEGRGQRARTRLEVWTVEPAPMPSAGPEMGAAIAALLGERGIGFHPRRRIRSADAGARTLTFEDGESVAYDLLIAVPPHRAPRVVVECGLAETGGWIPADPATLEVRKSGVAEQVYAIGDVSSVPLPGRWDPAVPLALPKAGVFAAAEGEVVAARIAAAVGGLRPPPAFDGRGYCFIETAAGVAMRGDGSFFEPEHPVMLAGGIAEAVYLDKQAWVDGWLGPADAERPAGAAEPR